MRRGSVVLGTFDGLHMGHNAVLSSAVSPATVITFDVPPAMRGKLEMLFTPSDKKECMTERGFSVDTLRFSEVCSIEAEDFLAQIDEKYKPAYICCGENYRFGRGAAGDINLIKAYCDKNGITACISPLVELDGVKISSSYIRGLIKEGDIARANRLLYKPFSIFGRVEHGDSRGRTIGLPTINFFYPENLVEPRHGVYGARLFIKGKEYSAITYIGKRPTYQLDRCICETNILDFTGDIYGEDIKVELLSFIREDKKFDSIEELKAQIENDIKALKKTN